MSTAQSARTYQSWKIGDVKITKIVETTPIVDIPNLFPQATVEAILAVPWLQPHFATPEGRGRISIHALVVETPKKRLIVDTCVGDRRDRAGWDHFHDLQTTFLGDLEGAGFARDSFDIVLCTHLHVDHVGWNTMQVNGKWVPTFPKARYLLNKTEYNHWGAPGEMPTDGGFGQVQWLTYADSIKPVFEAGLIDLVEGTHKVCDEVTLVPTVGHSPGHVSVRISSKGEEAFITGDISHHPSQLAYPEWRLPLDFDSDQAARTRQQVFADLADKPILVIGTHWAGATAGRVKRSGNVFRLEC